MLFDLDRNTRDGVKLTALSDVWPPSLFGWQLATFISKLDCHGKKMVDVGCGSGIQAIVAAKCGAVASASDISPAAVDITERNARSSDVTVRTRLGPGLEPWRGETFDLIVCNGPTYEPISPEMSSDWRLRPSGSDPFLACCSIFLSATKST